MLGLGLKSILQVVLLLESGVRFHTTKYARDKNDMPSPFAMKLRKFIRTRRLEDVRQLGSDRVVDFKFGSGDSVCHIILELYASGNIVLTDGSYEIQALLRSHQFEDDIAVKMHEIYPIAFTTSLEPVSTAVGVLDGTISSTVLTMSTDQFVEWASLREKHQMDFQQNREDSRAIESEKNGDFKGGGAQKKRTGGSKKSKLKKMSMRQLLLSKESGVASFGPEIIDHCLLEAQISPSAKVSDVLGGGAGEMVVGLLEGLRVGSSLLTLLDAPGQPGYILYRTRTTAKIQDAVNAVGDEEKKTETQEEYYDFVPRLFKQHAGTLYKEFSSFDEAVDDYFCKVCVS